MSRVGKKVATSWEELGKNAPVRVSLSGGMLVESGALVVDERRFPGRQARLVFAYLVSERARPVPRDELADAIWGVTPPPTWEKALIGIVSKLRTLLAECGLDGAATITSAFGCYQLHLPQGGWIDLEVAGEALDVADEAFAAGDFSEARSGAEHAVILVRRPFLPGEDGLWVEAKRRELQSLLVRALDRLTDACLGLGDSAEAVRKAGEAVELEPLREAGYQRLMRAHAAADNQAEALLTYERCRRRLAEELGAHPSAATQAIHLDILRGQAAGAESAPPAPTLQDGKRSLALEPSDPDLELPAAAPRAAARRTLPASIALALRRDRRLLVGGAVFLAVAVAATLVSVLTAGPSGLRRLSANSLGLIDERTNRIVADVPVGSRPVAVALGKEAVWVANAGNGTVSRVDPTTKKVLQTIGGVGSSPVDVAVLGGVVWVANGSDGTLSEIDARTNTVVETIDLQGPNKLTPEETNAVAAGAGSVWVASGLHWVLRIDPKTGGVRARIDVGSQAVALDFGEGGVWAATSAERAIRIEPRTNAVVARVPLNVLPVAIAAGGGSIWVAEIVIDQVWRLNPDTGAVMQTISFQSPVAGIAVDAGSVWVASGHSLSRVNGRGEITNRIQLGRPAADVVAGAGDVWVAAG
jgi:YVTN family beta-propeller protein